MTNYADYTIPENFNKTIREEYVRNWINSQLNATPSHQPTEEEIKAKYSEQIPADVLEHYKKISYTRYITQIEVPIPVVTSETWVFHNTLSSAPNTLNFNFTSKSTKFKGISGTKYLMKYVKEDGTKVTVYSDSFTDNEYKTIVLDTPATGTVLDFLSTNAEKQ